MTPDISLNGASVADMGWLREKISFPTPQSQTNTIVVREGTLPFVIQKLWGVYLSASELFFDFFYARRSKTL